MGRVLPMNMIRWLLLSAVLALGWASSAQAQTTELPVNGVATWCWAGTAWVGCSSSGGGSGLTFTDGTHTVIDATQLSVTGGVVGGTSPNATLTISASATSFTPGTTTILGATAPCFLVNSTGSVSACDALGSGIATALGVNVGSAGAPVLFNGVGGTPSSLTLTNATNLPFSANASGTNTTAAMVVGTGASLAATGTGTIIATSVPVTDTSHAGSFSSWNAGGQDDMSSSGTATFPTLTAGQSLLLSTQSGAVATLSASGITLNGIASTSTLRQFGFLSCVYNASNVYSCFGFPTFSNPLPQDGGGRRL